MSDGATYDIEMAIRQAGHLVKQEHEWDFTDVRPSSRMLISRSCSPVPRDLWESVTRSCPDFVATQTISWRDAVLASGAYKDVSMLYEFSSGRQVLLPMVQRRWRTPLEPTAGSWPRRWGVGGPLTSGGPIEAAEAAAVLNHVVRRDILGAEIHLSHISDPAWLHAASRSRVLPTRVMSWTSPAASTLFLAAANQPRHQDVSAESWSARALTSRLTVLAASSRSSTSCVRSPCSAGRRRCMSRLVHPLARDPRYPAEHAQGGGTALRRGLHHLGGQLRGRPRRRHHRLEGGLAGATLAGSHGQGTGGAYPGVSSAAEAGDRRRLQQRMPVL